MQYYIKYTFTDHHSNPTWYYSGAPQLEATPSGNDRWAEVQHKTRFFDYDTALELFTEIVKEYEVLLNRGGHFMLCEEEGALVLSSYLLTAG